MSGYESGAEAHAKEWVLIRCRVGGCNHLVWVGVCADEGLELQSVPSWCEELILKDGGLRTSQCM